MAPHILPLPRGMFPRGTLVAILASAQILAAEAGAADVGAAVGSHRAAQDAGLNLTISPDVMAENLGETASGAPPGSYRAAQDEPYRVDWSRRLGRQWELDPVLLNRRQSGRPKYPDSDASDKVLGIELHQQF